MKFFALAALCSALAGQVATIVPTPMQPLTLLQGEWHTSAGWIDFRFGDLNHTMTVRGRADKPGSPWRDMISIVLKDGTVFADFTDSNGRVVHYQMSTRPNTLAFVEDPVAGKPVHTMTYTRGPHPDQITYRLATGGQVTDSGVMTRRVLLRPLSE